VLRDSNVSESRARVEQYRSLLGPDNAWETLTEKFGDSWLIEAGTKRDRGGSSIQTAMMTMRSPTLADWSKAVVSTGTLELLPGVRIAKFEMRTSGNIDHRSVDLLRMKVEIHTRQPSPSSSSE
jgi:hypothetical protein